MSRSLFPTPASRSCLLFALLLAALLAPVLAGSQVFAFRDLADYAIPHKVWAASELRAGRLPLWNPYDYCGFPHLANLQSGVLYPINLLLLLPFPWGFDLSLAVHFLIAALGLAALARRAGSGEAGARVGGLAYGFSPFLLSLTDLNAFLATASWLPWQLVAGLGLAAAPGARTIAATALVFTLGFLAGEPQTFALGALLAAGASLAAALRSPRAPGLGGRVLRLGAAWAAAGVVTLLLVAPVLLPFLELAGLSERSGQGLSREQVFRYSLEPAGLATLVLPGFAGDVVRGSHWLGEQTYVRSPYLGVVVLALALSGALERRRGRFALVALALLGLALSLGPDGGLYPLLYELGFRQSRFPVKFLVLTTLAVSLLAARGGDGLVAVATDAVRARRRVGLALLLIGAGAVVARALVAVPAARAAATHATLVAGLGLAGLALLGRNPAWAGRGAGGAGLVLLAADLVIAARPVLTTIPAADLLRPAPAWSALGLVSEGEGGVAWPRVYTPPISVETLGRVYREGRVDGAALERKKALLFGNTNLLFGIPVVRGGESMEVRWTAALLDRVDRGPEMKPLLDLTGAGWFVGVDERGEAWVEENPTALPHAFFPERLTAASDSEALELMASNGFDPRALALVPALERAPAPGCGAGRARIVVSAPDRLRIEAESPGECLLVVTDTFYPGWEARLDGRPADIVRADHAFRGVWLRPGRQELEMRYRPARFRLGLGFAALGAALAGALLVLGRRAMT